MKSRIDIARKGERFIQQSLPGSQWLNEEKELSESYDLIWKGIKIDVKTTLQMIPGSNTACQFTVVPKKDASIILVMVAFIEEKVYVWVQRVIQSQFGYYKRLDQSMDISSLPNHLLTQFR